MISQILIVIHVLWFYSNLGHKYRRQALENIKSTLQRYGADMDDVVKCTVFLVNMAEWPRMNEVYKTYFIAPYPARSAVAGSGLALNARVEIECIVVLK